jgi:hypothetical protein
MKRDASSGAGTVVKEEGSSGKAPSGSQTLFRGLDLLDVVADSGTIGLPALAARLGLTRSTTHRLATALVEGRLLCQAPREGDDPVSESQGAPPCHRTSRGGRRDL